MLPGSVWDLFLQLLGTGPHLKNGWTIDPDGASGAPGSPNDNHGTIDPNRLKNGSQIDPDGARPVPSAPANDNRGTIDPNG